MGKVWRGAHVCLLAAVCLTPVPVQAELASLHPTTGQSPAPQSPQPPRGTPSPAPSRSPKQPITVRVRGYEIQTGKARRAGLPLPFAVEPGKPEAPAPNRNHGPVGPANSRILPAVAISDAVRQYDTLAQRGLAKTLADMVVLAAPGQPAKLRSGGEFAVPVPLPDGTFRHDVRFAGLEMEVTSKRVGDRVRLDCQITHSEKDLGHAVKTGGVLVPGLRSSRMNVNTDLEVGETCLLGQITPPLAIQPIVAKTATDTLSAANSPIDRTPPPAGVTTATPAQAEDLLFDPTDVFWLITLEQ